MNEYKEMDIIRGIDIKKTQEEFEQEEYELVGKSLLRIPYNEINNEEDIIIEYIEQLKGN